jgi:hypothetical protein
MGILSSITSVATGGMSTIYKYLAIGFIALGLAVGGYIYGVHMEGMKYKAQVAQLEAKYQKDETDLLGLQSVTNTKVVTQYVTKTVTIHDQVKQLQTQINDLHDDALLTAGWLRIADASASGDVSSTPSPTDGTPSTITAKQELGVVTANYGTCNQDSAELSALQDWLTQTQKNVATANKAVKK